MDKYKIQVFIALTSLIVLVFIAGIIYFVIEYRKRKLMNIKEQDEMRDQHRQELLGAQLEAQQQTMQHIGREIHDNVGQKLTLASLYSKQLLGKDAGVNDKISSIGNIIDESLAELRLLSKTLTNPHLAGAGLLDLLREEAERINASGICFIKISSNEKEIILPVSQKNILFRLLQEFIQNSLKHSGCRKIDIALNKENDRLLLDVADDGKGFDPAAASTGIGLHNMKRRAEELNAGYELNTSPGNGTRLKLQLTV